MLGIRNKKELAFVRNTSEANSIIVGGISLEPDDEVVLWDKNHQTNYSSWQYRGMISPYVCKPVSLDMSSRDVQYYVDAFVSALTPKTRVVSFSHISNISGLRLPAREICEAVKGYNSRIFIHIDGAQSWGSVDINLGAIRCDGFSSSGHKWLCGPHGSGILYIRDEWSNRVRPLTIGYDFNIDYPEDNLPSHASRFACLGQRNDAVFAAIGDAVDIHMAVGTRRIEERIRALTRHALNACEKNGLRLITPMDEQWAHGIIVIDVGNTVKAYGAFLALYNEGIAAAIIHNNKIHCTPDGRLTERDAPTYVRICPHIYNSTDDIDSAVDIIKRVDRSGVRAAGEFIRYFRGA